MRSRRAASSWTGLGGAGFLLVIVLLLTGASTLVALFMLGYLSPLHRAANPNAGKIAVPRSIRPLKAYAKVTREDVYDLQQGEESYFWMAPERVKTNPAWKIQPGDVIGRVMARDKRPGFVFTEKDFLPEGAREGIVGGIPPGKRAMVVRAEDVRGLEFLQQGDRFDLFATLSARSQRDVIAPAVTSPSEQDQFTGGTRPPEAAAIDLQKRLGIKLLVRNGVIIERRARASSGRTASSAWDVTIAVAAEEVMALTHALGIKHEIFTAARSGHPDESLDDEDPAHPLLRGMLPYAVRSATIPAYAEITSTHLIDPATGEVPMVYFPPDQVSPEWVGDFEQLVGRVAARDLHPGFLFQQSDFLPRGTRGGVTGGIPPGKLALPVPRDKIHGLSALQRGDRFDLVASLPIDLKKEFPQLQWIAGQQGPGQLGGLLESLQKQSSLSLLAQEALVVAGSSESSHITIAVNAEEVPALTRALAGDSEIYSIARSGHPDDPGGTALLNDPVPAARISVMEKISGKNRSLEMFSSPDGKESGVLPTLAPRFPEQTPQLFPPPSPERPPVESARPARTPSDQQRAT